MIDFSLKQTRQRADVAVVIVNYNSLQDIQRCIASLSLLTEPRIEIVLVDNASPDGSGAVLQREFQQDHVHVICAVENAGFAAGTNLGVTYARTLDVSYIWLLNPDTEVDKDSLQPLVQELEDHPEVAAAGSKILYGDGTQQRIWGCGGVIDYHQQTVSMRGAHEIDRGQYDSETSCTYLPGCSILVRSSVFNEVGMLPEDYFMYFEETEWCHLIASKGYTLRYVPRSRVIHHFSDEKMQTPNTVYYYNRNERMFWSRVGNVRQRLKLQLKALLKELPRNARAYFACSDAEQKRLFRAHLLSSLHFLFRVRGRHLC